MQFQYYETFLTLAKKSGCNLCSRLFFFTNDCNSQAKMLPCELQKNSCVYRTEFFGRIRTDVYAFPLGKQRRNCKRGAHDEHEYPRQKFKLLVNHKLLFNPCGTLRRRGGRLRNVRARIHGIRALPFGRSPCTFRSAYGIYSPKADPRARECRPLK